MTISKTKLGALIVVVAVLSAIGVCLRQRVLDSRLNYSIVVPMNIPSDVTLYAKHGESHTASGRDLYMHSHRNGWDECLADFQAGRLTTDSEPSIKQQFGIEAEAEAVGYNECKRELLRLIAAHGKLCVKMANR